MSPLIDEERTPPSSVVLTPAPPGCTLLSRYSAYEQSAARAAPPWRSVILSDARANALAAECIDVDEVFMGSTSISDAVTLLLRQLKVAKKEDDVFHPCFACGQRLHTTAGPLSAIWLEPCPHFAFFRLMPCVGNHGA